MHDIGPIFEMMRNEVAMGPIHIKEISEKGIPIIGTYCTYTPWELINAAGGIPVSLCSTSEKPIGEARSTFQKPLSAHQVQLCHTYRYLPLLSFL